MAKEFEIPPSAFKLAYSEDNFDDYRAAPLLIVGGRARKDLVESQDAMALKFSYAVQGEIGYIVKPKIVSFVARSIISRMHQREGLNSISYIKRLNRVPHSVQDIPMFQTYHSCRQALHGGASVHENDVARRAYQMGSIEYTNLTIIGDFRKNLEQPMWDEVSQLVEADATPQADQMYGLQVMGFDRDITKNRHIGAMRIGMKRQLGTLDDGTIVKARTAAIINTSPSGGFDQDIVGELQEAIRENKSLIELPEFQRAVSWLISTDLSSGLVLARNETVYGVNEEIQEAVAKRHRHHFPVL